MTVSIIVPIFNVERYIHRCIKSLLHQTSDSCEIILVNDGSTDSTMQHVLHLVEGKQNVKVFNKKNGGVSSARNYGLAHATGDWILFVDSDDEVLPDYVATLIGATSGFDWVLSGDMYLSNGHLIREDILPAWRWEKTDGWHENDIKYVDNITSLHGKLFRRSIIEREKLRFDTSVNYGEDRDFCISYLLHVASVCYIPYAGYCYHTDVECSLSKQKVANLLNTDIEYWNKVHELLGINCSKYQVNRLFNFIADDLVTVFHNSGCFAALRKLSVLRNIVDVRYLYIHSHEIDAPRWQISLFLFLVFMFNGKR